MKQEFTEIDKRFLAENYPTEGMKFCMERLDHLSKSQIVNYLYKKRILLTKTSDKENNDVNLFINPTTANMCYFLGYLWADGYISRRKMRDGSLKSYNIVLSLSEKDGPLVLETVESLARFTVTRQTRGTSKVFTMIIHDVIIARYLESMDYTVKSIVSPSKILSTIPDDLKRYFWLGFLDGDGSIMANPKKGNIEISFSGTKDLDWSDLTNLLKDLRCNFNKQRRETEKRSFSEISIRNAPDAVHFGKYLYQSYKSDGIGLQRKYEKFLEILEMVKTRLNLAKEKKGVIIRKKGFVVSHNSVWLGCFETQKEAAIHYDLKMIELFGHKALTNFPLDNYIKLVTKYWEN